MRRISNSRSTIYAASLPGAPFLSLRSPDISDQIS
nr:MAG TPA: hypothetical protein [Caudoviricetes sp.]